MGSEGSDDDGIVERLRGQKEIDRLADALGERDAGELFSDDLEEARELAEDDPRFRPLVEGLESDSLGERMEAVDRFFDGFDAEELAELDLPRHLSQLRYIYLRSGSGSSSAGGD